MAIYEDALAQLQARQRLRRLALPAGADFTSNDYLGLATCSRLRAAVADALARGTGIGAGGSRLLRGNTAEHEALEAAAAEFFGSESALYFGGGYVANFAVLSTLPQTDDLVVLDELAHASANEGARMGRAQRAKARHNDLQSFDEQIVAWRARGGRGRPWIVVESLYSMDGDYAPLRDFMDLADRHDGVLYADEAHATGVYGPDGRGLVAQFEGRSNVLTLHTCSKALGSAGALVAGPQTLVRFLVNRCRPFIFATAPSPLMAVAASEALRIMRDEPERRMQLEALVEFTRTEMRARGIDARVDSQIVPFIVGADASAMQLATALQARGFDVRGIRPPTVPEGTARLRISLTLNVDRATVAALLNALTELLAALSSERTSR